MTIRRARITDSEAIANLMLLAMEDIVFRFIGKNDKVEARIFMLRFVQREHTQYSWRNCWVVEDSGELLASANIYDGGELQYLRQPVIDYIGSVYNRALKPEDETGPGEYYIDTLAVRPDQQGKGIGTRFLQFLITEYVLKSGYTLALLVDEGNKAARRLYVKLGFKTAGRKMLVGKRMERLQFKPV